MRADLLRLGRNTLTYGVGLVLTRLVSLLLLPVFTAYLSPEDYGISSLLAVLVLLVSSIFALGVSGALGIVYFERGEPDHKSAAIWSAFVTLVVSAGLLTICGLLFAQPVAAALFPDASVPYDLGFLVALSIITAAAAIVAQPLLLHLQLEERAKVFVAITAGSASLSIALSVLLIVVLERGVAGFIEAGVVAQLVTLGVALVVASRRIPFRIRRSVAFNIIRLGIPLVPTYLAIFLTQQGNKFILQQADGLGAVGIYTVGFNIGMFATLLVSGFTAAWFPFFSSYMERQGEAPPVFARVFTYYVLGVGTVSLFFFALARPAILLLTQPSFHEAYVSVGPSAAAQFLIGVHSVIVAGMYLAKDVRYAFAIQGGAALVSIALSLSLIPVMGARGAAVALALGFLAMVMLQYAWNRARGYIHVPYASRRVGYFAAGYVVIAGALLFERDWAVGAEILASSIACLAIVGFAWALLTHHERSQAFELLRGFGGKAQRVRS